MRRMANSVNGFGYSRDGSFSGSVEVPSPIFRRPQNGQYQVRKYSDISMGLDSQQGSLRSVLGSSTSLNNQAAAWAARHGFDSQQVNDILQVMNLITQDNGKIHILASELEIKSEIDRGSFGVICEGSYKGSKVAVKKISAVIYPVI